MAAGMPRALNNATEYAEICKTKWGCGMTEDTLGRPPESFEEYCETNAHSRLIQYESADSSSCRPEKIEIRRKAVYLQYTYLKSFLRQRFLTVRISGGHTPP